MESAIIVETATGNIVNRIVLLDPADWVPVAGHVIVDDTASPMAIGGTYVDGVYTPPPSLPGSFPTSVTVTSRQFWTQLALQGLIDESEAVDALGGDIPNDIKQFINGLPLNQRFVARMFFTAPTFELEGRVSQDMQSCFSLAPAAVKTFFLTAASL